MKDMCVIEWAVRWAHREARIQCRDGQTEEQHPSILDATVDIGQRPHCTRTLITSRLVYVKKMPRYQTHAIRESLIS